ncbi:MAG: hypothetical protein M3O34_17675 [Chloroflexota bacterium]|nr:hypothetical protein [Chloroflexota bacterium]
MELRYDPRADAASVLLRGPIEPGGEHHKERLDADRFVRYADDGPILEYEFLNVRRYGVKLDDLEHRDELTRLFAEAGFSERDWGHAVPTTVIRRRRSGIAG